MYYIFICLNGEWKEEKMSDTTERFWECDYNEIVTDDIDIEDVRENPDDYIDYDFRDRKGVVEKRLSALLKAKKITKDERDYVLTGRKSLSLSRQAVSKSADVVDEPVLYDEVKVSEEADDLTVKEEITEELAETEKVEDIKETKKHESEVEE
jgi:hypothetical protein